MAGCNLMNALLVFFMLWIPVDSEFQISSRCGEGNACLCSPNVKIVSCVSARLTSVPSLSHSVRQWVSRMNLRFNNIHDLAKLLDDDFPKLQMIDVRDNSLYICGDIHELLLSKGLIIQADCNSKLATTTSSSTVIATTTACVNTTIKGRLQTNVNITGKVDCKCDIAISISAVISSTISVLGTFLMKRIMKKLWKKIQDWRNSRNIVDRRFDTGRRLPGRQLFNDTSMPSTSMYGGRQHIYEAPVTSDSDDDQYLRPIPSIPVPSRPVPSRPVPSRPVPSIPLPTKQIPVSRSKFSPKRSSTSSTSVSTQTSVSNVSTTATTRLANKLSLTPSSDIRSVSSRGRGRGRGRKTDSNTTLDIELSDIHIVSGPAANTRSQNLQDRNIETVTHM